jgi:hypothetical protein
MSTLTTPEISEKIHAFNTARKIGEKLEYKKISLVFEEAKNIIFPLVSWLDKPIKEHWSGEVFPVEFGNRRIMPIFCHSTGVEFLEIGIQRSGMWLIKTVSNGRTSLDEVDSQELVELVLTKTRTLLKRLSLGQTKEIVDKFSEKLPFLEGVVIYNGILVILSMCFDNISQILNEREERLKIMRERANLLKDFSFALDPLVIKGKNLTIKTYSLWCDSAGGGSRRCSEDYLSESQMDLIFGVSEKRNAKFLGSNYTREIDESKFSSIKNFLHSMRNLVEEIFRAEKENKTTVESLSGYNYGRLPFSEDELENIRKLSVSITG